MPLMRKAGAPAPSDSSHAFPSLDNPLISAAADRNGLPRPLPPPNATSRRFGKGKPRPRAPGLCCDAGCSDQVEATDGCAATRSNKVSMILLTKRCSVLLSL
jgi:hypothetical protein